MAAHEVPRRPAVHHVPSNDVRVLLMQSIETVAHLGHRGVAGPEGPLLLALLAGSGLIHVAATDGAPFRGLLPNDLCIIIKTDGIMRGCTIGRHALTA